MPASLLAPMTPFVVVRWLVIGVVAFQSFRMEPPVGASESAVSVSRSLSNALEGGEIKMVCLLAGGLPALQVVKMSCVGHRFFFRSTFFLFHVLQ